MEEVHHTVTADPVLFNDVADNVCSHMAVWHTRWMAVFPNRIRHHTYFLLRKLLHSDVQEAACFPTEGSPERLSVIYERTCKRDALSGTLCTEETEG